MTSEQFRLERELFVRALMPTMHGDGAARIAALLKAGMNIVDRLRFFLL